MAFFSVEVILLIVLSLVDQLHHKPIKFRKMKMYTSKMERGLALQRRDQHKTKATVLTRTYERLQVRKALRIWQDFATCATYRASPQAAAKARVVALQAAIDVIAAEQNTRNKGAGACRLSYSAASRVVPSSFRLSQGAVSRVGGSVDMLGAP